MKKLLVVSLTTMGLLFSGQQFAMSDSDRAMYTQMLEANPGEIMIEEGNEKLEDFCGGEEGLAQFLGQSEDTLPSYIAGFPRYIKKLSAIVGLDQVLQVLMMEKGHKAFKLKSEEMLVMSAYAKSLANEEKINIDVNANKPMKQAFILGKYIYEVKRGKRGLSCLSCHSKNVVGSLLRTQSPPDLGVVSVGGTWPAYRMTKSSLRTMQRRFQGCMNNALQEVLPLGSKEMVALEVYITNLAYGNEIIIPGLKR